jgi:hypothetical protein
VTISDLIGWKLGEARVALAQDESTRGLNVRLVETAAPLRKNQTAEEQAAKLGVWRVLRARLVKNEIELTVAREQCTE